ncbi:hypothetical protein H7I77_05420 [Mycolicibacterium novocastrense]|uniref:Uncharacterized protein n=1 Tax=Mycolicibacterium novocastrense TaxID=59813 RepID=A0AAW5SI92_MYCNV|nr:hypothetical protein [Mycolicibacterium novocastrense]MCV7022792.1 hypothetical protein [Mycolicibacterium novocastrense]GAT10366.1 uncharacterized protein RMCN_3499 [Mycolicibacterium novocastrense]
MTTFDIADIVELDPSELGPTNSMELMPGLWIPDPGVNQMKPGVVSDENVRMPLYASDIYVTTPGSLGPYGMQELGKGTGVWIPHPRSNEFRPGSYTPPQGEKPIQIEDIKFLPPGALGPRGYIPLGDSGAWIPGPDTVKKGVRPASNTTEEGENAQSDKDVFAVNYNQLEGFAQNHDQQADQVAQWAKTDTDFAERLLATHGKVAYATYLNVKGYNESRVVEAGAYAQRNSDTAVGLRGAIDSTKATDENAASAFRAPTINT